VALSGAALYKYRAGQDASQVELDHLNVEVRSLNIASIACYSAALAAGLAWGWLRWREADGYSVSVVPDVGERRLAFLVGRAF
jgi:hypothetical protein